MINLITQKSRSTKNKPSEDGPGTRDIGGTFDKKTKPCGGVKKHSITMRPGYGKPIEEEERYLGTEDLQPEAELISEPICFTGQAFEQHINWADKGNTM